MNIVIFIVLTLIAYVSIDFAVYWVGTKESITFNQIIIHHLKMLPIYLTANIALSFGFIKGNGVISPLLLFSISILIWIVSLLIVSIVLYKTQINLLIIIGLMIVVVGVVVVNKGLGSI